MKKVLAIIGVVLVVIGGLALIAFTSMGENYNKIIEASVENGNIPEKVVGDPDTAKVVLYEYADYGCTHCAEWNGTIKSLVKKYNGDLAVVFRSFDLGYQNGHNVSLAATAAQLQGYWEEFKDILFENQEEWFYASTSEIVDLLVEYFEQVSGEKGDTTKFLNDMRSENVEKRVNFENKIGINSGVNGTPTFRIKGQDINLGNLEDTIENKIKQAK